MPEGRRATEELTDRTTKRIRVQTLAAEFRETLRSERTAERAAKAPTPVEIASSEEHDRRFCLQRWQKRLELVHREG